MSLPDDPALTLSPNANRLEVPPAHVAAGGDTVSRAMCFALVLFPLTILFYFGFEDMLRFAMQPAIARTFSRRGWEAVNSGWLDLAPFVLPIFAGAYIGVKFPRRGAIGTLAALLLLSAIGLPIFARTFALATDMRHPHVWHAGENYYAFSDAPVLFEPGLIICLVIGGCAAAIAGKIKLSRAANRR